MSRSRRRVSRKLVVVLSVAVGAGIAAGIHKLASNKQTPQPLVAESISPAPVELQIVPPVGPLVTQTPTTQPAAIMSPVPTGLTPAAVSPQPVLAVPQVESPKTQPSALHSNDPLADGKSLFDTGDLLHSRAMLSDALLAGRLSSADAVAAKELLGKISQSVIFSRKVYPGDTRCQSYSVQFGDTMQRIAASHGITWELLSRINGISDPRRLRAGQTLKVIDGPFHAVVSKSRFALDIYLGAPAEPGSALVASFGVGLGKDDSTPAGSWIVEPQKKLKNPTYYSPRGEGIVAADDPANPLGEFWIGLSGTSGEAVGRMSYGIHGTIDPNSIGKKESMGCIRMRNEDVAVVFELLVEGKSTVTVKE